MMPPDGTDNVSDAARVRLGLRREHGIKDATISLPALRELPGAAREGDWVVTAVAAEPCDTMPCVSGFEAGDTTERQYAVAVDIGTTTVEVALVDLNSGKIIAKAAEYNAQVSLGEDVISRVIAASTPDGLEELHKLAVQSVSELATMALSEAGADVEDVVSYYVAPATP